MNNISPGLYKKIQEVICRPNGTVTFNYTFKDLFNPEAGNGIIFEVPSKGHLFRIERDKDLRIHFFHSSPGTDTRVATIDLNKITGTDTVFMGFSWSPKEIKFFIGPKTPGGEVITATGRKAKKQFRVGNNGKIYQIGSPGVEIMGLRIRQGGKTVLEPTAIQAWNEIKKAIEILNTGESKQGYIFETVLTNLTLAMLVTGFEAYTKKRFLELEQEGIGSNLEGIIDKFMPKKEKEARIVDILKSEAQDNNKTPLQFVVERGYINFQNYQKCKDAYDKAYQIQFGDLSISPSSLEQVKRFIKYRHRIIHVSALLGILNQSEIPPEKPVFPKKELASLAIQEFDTFIFKLHDKTLKLKTKT